MTTMNHYTLSPDARPDVVYTYCIRLRDAGFEATLFQDIPDVPNILDTTATPADIERVLGSLTSLVLVPAAVSIPDPDGDGLLLVGQSALAHVTAQRDALLTALAHVLAFTNTMRTCELLSECAFSYSIRIDDIARAAIEGVKK